MENGSNTFISILSNDDRGQSSNNNNNHAWDTLWALNNSRFDWGNSSSLYTTAATAAQTTDKSHRDANKAHALLFPHSLHHHQHHNQSVYISDGSNLHPDPHLMCLKLGKRHYFEDARALSDGHVQGFSMVKKGKPYYTFGGGVVGPSSSPVLVSSTATVPRCQVEGCDVALINAKDYHRRHKVCEMHSKAPKVVVLGLEQRFCQQCSRFHVVSEFDDSKRSCRRRLAGHNERRRKSTHDALSRNSSQVNKLMSGTFPSAAGRALSLLSSKAAIPWVPSSDLSSRCSATLQEQIAENRSPILARHLILGRDWNLHHAAEDPGEALQTGNNLLTNDQHQILNEPQSWGGYQKTGAHLTFDLMQAPSEEFGYLSVRGKTNEEEEEECTELWSSLEGDNVA